MGTHHNRAKMQHTQPYGARAHTHTLRQFWQTLMRVIRRRMIGCGLDVRSKWSLCSRQIQCSQCLSLLLSCLNKSHMTNAFVQNCPEVQKNHMLHKHIDLLTCERACTCSCQQQSNGSLFDSQKALRIALTREVQCKGLCLKGG